ncbi:MAG TPA: proline--tRNA ligase [Dehalococcoidia bacterium]|nr:proline--tRNA ligase [Dehalococcoidia bacterium]
MKLSAVFGKTLRDAPTEAEHDSHRLLLRAGLVQQIAAGMYSYLPLGTRVLHKIEQIVRQEFDRAGGQELLLPVLSPADLWEESGRYSEYGPTLMTMLDRRERQFVLGPTHEEVIVDVFRRSVQSYKELPQLLYQIQTKFRDEARPRLGLIRCREFIMADLYSFHADEPDLDQAYDAMYEAYQRIYQRCGVPATVVDADSGAIGGKESQEFMLLTPVGEDETLICPNCGYAANTEKAELRKPPLPPADLAPLEEVSTPGQKTIDDLVTFLQLEPSQTLKAVFYLAEYVDARREPVFVAIRGDLEVNEIKLKNALKALDLHMMSEDEVTNAGLVAGSASPVGLNGIKILADDSVVDAPNLVAGANKPDVHYKNVNQGRDWQADIVTDIALAREGDACGRCGTPFESKRGIEMGHIFKLGTRYTDRMNVRFLDAAGREQTPIMGCYGIGTSRLLQCVIEANHDERGIVWPANLAPYDLHIVGLGLDRPEVASKAEALYDSLRNAGLDVLFDDRLEPTAGVKFNDADLIGLPLRVTVSPRSLEKGAVEVKARAASDIELVPYEEALGRLKAMISA